MPRTYRSLLILLLFLFPAAHAQGQDRAGAKHGAIAQTPSLPIYDAYLIQLQSTSPDERPYIKKNTFAARGERKNLSTLQHSTARLIPCNSAWGQDALLNLTKNFDSTKYPETAIWEKLTSVQGLAPQSCASIDFADHSIALISFSMTAQALDSSDHPNRLIWISKLDKSSGKLGKLLYAGVTIDSRYETKRLLTIEAVADVNDDGLHEVILHDVRFAVDLYTVFFFDRNGLVGKKDIPRHGRD